MRKEYICKYDPDHGGLGSPLGARKHYEEVHGQERAPRDEVRCIPCGRLITRGGIQTHLRGMHGKRGDYVRYWQSADIEWTPHINPVPLPVATSPSATIKCDKCGLIVQRQNMRRHQRSQQCKLSAVTQVTMFEPPAPTPDPPQSVHHSDLMADDIVIPVISELTGGTIRASSLDVVFRWRDETALMLARLRER